MNIGHGDLLAVPQITIARLIQEVEALRSINLILVGAVIILIIVTLRRGKK